MPKRNSPPADIRQLLEEIVERLAARGLSARIYVVGGAAFALTLYGDHERRGTLDIDASIRLDEAVAEEIAAMAIMASTTTAEQRRQAGVPAPMGSPTDHLDQRDGVMVILARPTCCSP